jgi:putative membrane protein insertion efficiency factor
LPARLALIGAIRLYRGTLSGVLGSQCRFYPSCSRYAEEAIRIHGAARGTLMGVWRVLRCNPFGPGGVDEVPEGRSTHGPYDGVIPGREVAR